MGNSLDVGRKPLPLSRDELALLTDTTHYSLDELETLRNQWYSDCGAYLTSDQFLVAAEACGIRSEAVRYMLLNAFDLDGDDKVTFFEFAQATSIMSRGTNDEKLSFAFRMYDVRRCNTIFYSDALQILRGLERSFGQFSLCETDGSHTGLSASEVAERLFKGARQVCRSEFLNFVRVNPSVIRGLELA